MAARLRSLLVPVVVAAAGLAATGRGAWAQPASSQERAPLNGRDHVFVVPAGWTAQAGSGVAGGDMTLKAPSGEVIVYVTAERSEATGDLAAQAATLARGFADGLIAKFPHLQRDAGARRRFAGADGTMHLLAARSGATDYPQRVVVIVALAPGTSYAVTAFGAAEAVRRRSAEIDAILTGVALAPAAPVAPPAPEASWRDEPPAPVPAGGAPLVDDPVLGLTIDPLPDWGVWIGAGQYVLERRFGAAGRVIVGVSLGSLEFDGDGASYAVRVDPSQRSEWGRYARRTVLVRRIPPAKPGEPDWLETHVLRRGRPIVLSFRADGLRWGEPRAEQARVQLEKAITISAPLRVEPGRRARVPVGGYARVELPRTWRVSHVGPAARVDFEGPRGVQATVIVASDPGSFPGVVCDSDHGQPEGVPGRVAGRAAMRFECPLDLKGQVGYQIRVPPRLVSVFLTDLETKATRGPVLDFLKLLELP